MNQIADIIGDVIQDVTGSTEPVPRLIVPPGERAVGPFVLGQKVEIEPSDENQQDPGQDQ